MATPAPRSDRFEPGRVDRSAPTQRDYVNHDKQVGASVRRNPLELDFTIFQVTEQPSLRLYLYTPAADGPTEAKLR